MIRREKLKPVYIINGFLDSGKTDFFRYTIAQPYFRTKGKTLLIVCEEGENDYEEKLHLLSRFMGIKENINALTKDLKSMADDSKTGKVLDSSLDEIVLRLGNIVDEL